jgi:hypothetical protein
VNVVASDLTGPGTIGASNVKLYREHYVPVSSSSPGSPYPPGKWPDALVPFVNPDTGAPLRGQIPAAPFNVPANTNQPVWVDVYVPSGVPAGHYTGSLTVTADLMRPQTVPITLKVWRFTLPTRSSLRSAFGELWDVPQRHGVAEGSAEYMAIARRYHHAALAHRVTPSLPEETIPAIRSNGVVDTSRSHAAMAHYMDTLGATSWMMPFNRGLLEDLLGADRQYALNYLRSLHDYLVQNDWADRAFVSIFDEPETAAAYADIRPWAALVHEADADIKFLLTEQPTPDNPSFGTLYGSVDIWVPPAQRFDAAAAAARQALGEEVWVYFCLWQCDGCPTWQIDYPLIDYRIPTWISWVSKIQGLLYWAMTYWPNDPWVNPVGWYYAGDGILFYPGKNVGYDGPVASMRLKSVREGMEDYEYLQLLKNLGDPATADMIARSMATSLRVWKEDPNALLQARDTLAARIEALSRE